MSAGVPAPCHVAGNNDRYRSAPKASAPSASGQTLACRPKRASRGRWRKRSLVAREATAPRLVLSFGLRRWCRSGRIGLWFASAQARVNLE
jgi:hypothetical protein